MAITKMLMAMLPLSTRVIDIATATAAASIADAIAAATSTAAASTAAASTAAASVVAAAAFKVPGVATPVPPSIP